MQEITEEKMPIILDETFAYYDNDRLENILKYLNNEHTKVERKEGFMGNYYSNLIDTIYIAEDFENSIVPETIKNMNKKAAEAVYRFFHSSL